MATVLIVDSDADASARIARELDALGLDAVISATGAEALVTLSARAIDAVLLAWVLADMRGAELLARLQSYPSIPPVTVLMPEASADALTEALRLGAYGGVIKPVSRDELARALHHMLQRTASTADAPFGMPDGRRFIAVSKPMRRVQKAIRSAAATDKVLLIVGEIGTGKDTTARIVHQCSRRREGVFVAVDCAAVSPDLLEEELFGHNGGVYEGPTMNRRGAFRQADAGTLFLDNIESVALATQVKILDTLECRSITAAGGRAERVDVRLIAATRHSLDELVRRGRFHESLYRRLDTMIIELPPLRDRLADLLPLAEHFLELAAPGAPKRLSNEAAARLLSCPWRGNLHELKNAMERLTVFSQGNTIAADDLYFLAKPASDPGELDEQPPGELPTAVARLEALLIHRALCACHGNRACAARRLNIRRQLLYDKMRRYGLMHDTGFERQLGEVPGRPAAEQGPSIPCESRS